MSSPLVKAAARITNESGESASIYWVNPHSFAHEFYRELPAGESYLQPSYIGHFWILKVGNEPRSSFCVSTRETAHRIEAPRAGS